MPDAFIIYSRPDRDAVTRLVQHLKRNRLRIWFDVEQLEPGDSIVAKIEEGVENSRWLVIIVSRNGKGSNWWRAEYSAAIHRQIRRNEQQIIPVLLDDVEEDDIPFLLTDRHYIDLNEPDGLQRLVERLKRRFSLTSYFATVRQSPLVSGRLFNSSYHVEPAHLLQSFLREIPLQTSEFRAVRANSKPVSLSQFSADLITKRSTDVVVVVGEAGVGKSTTCRLLCRDLVQSRSATNVAPFLIPLGQLKRHESFTDYLDRLVIGGSFKDLATAAKSSGRRLIVFLDGLNEQPHSIVNSVLAWTRRLIRSQATTVMMTSRPLIAVADLWPDDNVRLFELQRWTREQLVKFFERNDAIDFVSQLPQEALDCLRLPLLASLVIRRPESSAELRSFNTLIDVFEYLLAQFLKSAAEKKKGRNVSASTVRLKSNYRKYLSALAHQMTANRTIMIEGKTLESLLLPADQPHFKSILANLINSGLIRSASNLIALDPAATKRELRTVEIGFLHQSFQEYLTAQHLKPNWKTKLPADVSHDAFWREIPIYLVRSLAGSSSRQQDFASSFLNGKSPDFLTAARLSRAIEDPGISKLVRDEVLARLLRNITRPNLYAFAIETFIALGDAGRHGLRQCLLRAQVNKVVSRFETHLIEANGASADEDAWRPLGRSIYLLGELGDFWLVEYLDHHLEEFSSLHLLYHIGEALLTLARRAEITDALRKQVTQIADRLARLPHRDAVTIGYADAIRRSCGAKSRRQVQLAGRLREFLIAQKTTARTHFKDEFWRRAHGAEAFAELTTPKDGVQVLKLLFEAEELADYSGHDEVGYNQVQSSILKSMLRLRNSSDAESADWRALLEAVFMSRRVAANAWACRHLEYLLSRWFSKPDDLNWLKKWQRSRSLGGELIGSTIANIILLSG